MSNLTAPLLSHALEYLETSVTLLQRNPPEPTGDRDARQAIVLLGIAIELLLKSRLVEAHWALVFERVDDASGQRYRAGDFKSATLDQCVQRLIDIEGVDLTGFKKGALTNFKKLRNKTVHFASIGTEAALKVTMFEALSELIDFVKAECMPQAAEDAARLGRIELVLGTLAEYVATRMAVIGSGLRELLDEGYFCPTCGQRAVDVTQHHCLFCRADHGPPEVMELHLEKALGYTERLHTNDRNQAICHCGGSAVVTRLDGATMRCMYCAADSPRAELRQCPTCSRWRFPESLGIRCQWCEEGAAPR